VSRKAWTVKLRNSVQARWHPLPVWVEIDPALLPVKPMPSHMNPSENHSSVSVALPSFAPYRQVAAWFLLAMAASWISSGAHAQTADPAAVAVATPPQEAPLTRTAPADPGAATTVKYAAKDIDRAFGYMDSNRDGKVSREEASGFKSVAKYFDQADTDKDGMLTRDEFARALNRKKSDATSPAGASQAAVVK
jgi:hypothetical protein